MIKLIILDVDGVMTDGRKYYDRDGVVRLKTFCDKDWTAIKRFRAIGINVIFLTGDPFNVTIGENRNIDVIVNRASGNSEIIHKDKSEYLPKICEDYKVSPDEIAFIGDDVNDLSIIHEVGFSACPNDAMSSVSSVVDYVCVNKGGQGAFRELAELIISAKL